MDGPMPICGDLSIRCSYEQKHNHRRTVVNLLDRRIAPMTCVGRRTGEAATQDPGRTEAMLADSNTDGYLS
jgi:hypothetical protein